MDNPDLQVITETIWDKPFQHRSILNNDFSKSSLHHSGHISHANAPERRGFDPETTVTNVVVEHQALQHRAPGKNGIEGALGDVEALEGQRLEVWEIEGLTGLWPDVERGPAVKGHAENT